MDDFLRAGSPLLPPDPQPVESTPEPPPPPPRTRKKRRGPRRRQPHWTVRALRGLLGALMGMVLVAGVAGVAGVWMVYEHFAAGLPDVDGLRVYQTQTPVMSRVFANDGRLLADLATERRIFVPIAAMPDIVRQAFLSAEDRNFYIHKGVDPLAILRASVANMSSSGRGKRPSGASTITQQVAKNMLLDYQMTFARKAKEAILALRIEKTLPKNQILELYLNEIYLGLGAYGVASAAEIYFNKTLDQLTVSEAAFLAVLPKAPNNYNPFRHPDAARIRRDWVLDRMTEDRNLTPEQAALAKQEPIVPIAFKRPQVVSDADWFAEEVRRQLIGQFGQDATTKGLSVRTSLDPAMQAAADRALRNGLIAYDRKLGGWRGPVTHINGLLAELEREWPGLLARVPRTPGMLPNWRLAVVLSATDTEARVGWLSGTGMRGITPRPHLGTIPLSDVIWARPLRKDDLGPAPKRIGDVMQVGDVVMVEPSAAVLAETAPKPTDTQQTEIVTRPAGPATKVTLRQIPGVQGALVCVDPVTGRVLAMVGGFSFEQSQFNRVTQAQRQPGSSFKPMVYLTALQSGMTPNTAISNNDVAIPIGGGNYYEPMNSSQTSGGSVPMRTALQFSMNIPTARLAWKVGMTAVAKTAAAFHFHDALPHVYSAALGSVETTVLREAGAYAALANGGREVIPTLIDSVQDRNGRIVWRPHALECPACSDPRKPPAVMDMRTQIADPYSVRTLIDMMMGVVSGGTGRAAAQGINRPIAGKTGTSQDYGDAWFSGFTADLVTTVWVGYDNNYSLGVHEEGGVLAAPIWREFMTEALKGRPVLQFPPASGPRMNFPASEGGNANALAAGGGSTSARKPSGARSPVAVHGGVDNKLGGLY